MGSSINDIENYIKNCYKHGRRMFGLISITKAFSLQIGEIKSLTIQLTPHHVIVLPIIISPNQIIDWYVQ